MSSIEIEMANREQRERAALAAQESAPEHNWHHLTAIAVFRRAHLCRWITSGEQVDRQAKAGGALTRAGQFENRKDNDAAMSEPAEPPELPLCDKRHDSKGWLATT